MDYELAEKLYDAGFRRKGLSEEDIRNLVNYEVTKGDIIRAIMMTELSELIEACGEEFHSVGKEEEHIEGSEWISIADHDGIMAEYGSTPEEAVARLLLAIKRS